MKELVVGSSTKTMNVYEASKNKGFMEHQRKVFPHKNSFDTAFYNELVQCIERYDARLLGVINSQWRGFRSYANAGGNPGIDDWISCDTRVSNLINRKH